MGVSLKRNTVIAILLLLAANVSFLTLYTCFHNTGNCVDMGKVKFIDTATVDGREYTLLMRQTGFQDKVQFLLLYPNDIVFDSCGNPVGDEIADETIDYGPEKGPIIQWPEKIEIKNKQIIIYYTKDVKKRKPLVDVPVIWH